MFVPKMILLYFSCTSMLSMCYFSMSELSAHIFSYTIYFSFSYYFRFNCSFSYYCWGNQIWAIRPRCIWFFVIKLLPLLLIFLLSIFFYLLFCLLCNVSDPISWLRFYFCLYYQFSHRDQDLTNTVDDLKSESYSLHKLYYNVKLYKQLTKSLFGPKHRLCIFRQCTRFWYTWIIFHTFFCTCPLENQFARPPFNSLYVF